MSDAHHEHQSAIRTPKQLAAAVIGFFLVVILGIILLVQYVTQQRLPGAGSTAQTPEAVASRLKPVADEGFTLKDANGPKVLQTGEAIYTSTCQACHGAGVAGAPKVGDAGAWGARIAQGYDTIVKHAIEGIRAMPAKGGNPELDDVEVARAVVFMANQSGAKFKEPEVPAAPAAAAAGDAAAPAAAPAAEPPKG
jgi:cytochrome c5